MREASPKGEEEGQRLVCKGRRKAVRVTMHHERDHGGASWGHDSERWDRSGTGKGEEDGVLTELKNARRGAQAAGRREGIDHHLLGHRASLSEERLRDSHVISSNATSLADNMLCVSGSEPVKILKDGKGFAEISEDPH